MQESITASKSFFVEIQIIIVHKHANRDSESNRVIFVSPYQGANRTIIIQEIVVVALIQTAQPASLRICATVTIPMTIAEGRNVKICGFTLRFIIL